MLDQLHERNPDATLPQPREHERLERLDDQSLGIAPARRAQLGVDQLGHVEPEASEGRRVLDLEHDADSALAREVEHIAQQEHRLGVVVRGTRGPQGGDPLAAAQRHEFGRGEIFGEPPRQALTVDRLGGAPRSEFGAGRDVGRRADLVLVPHDEHAVFRRHDVGFDGIHPVGNGPRVGRP